MPTSAATQIYTKLDFQHLAKVYDAAHPARQAQVTPFRRWSRTMTMIHTLGRALRCWNLRGRRVGRHLLCPVAQTALRAGGGGLSTGGQSRRRRQRRHRHRQRHPQRHPRRARPASGFHVRPIDDDAWRTALPREPRGRHPGLPGPAAARGGGPLQCLLRRRLLAARCWNSRSAWLIRGGAAVGPPVHGGARLGAAPTEVARLLRRRGLWRVLHAAAGWSLSLALDGLPPASCASTTTAWPPRPSAPGSANS